MRLLEDQITWTTFDIQGLNNRNYSISKAITGGLMVYKNFVLSLTVNTEDPKSLSVAIMNLESKEKYFSLNFGNIHVDIRFQNFCS